MNFMASITLNNKGGLTMIDLIKELQWIDIREYDQEMIKCNLFCPACGAAKVISHHPWYKIKRVIEGVE